MKVKKYYRGKYFFEDIELEMPQAVAALDNLEASWADFYYGASQDTEHRPQRIHPDRITWRCTSFERIHTLLDVRREEFINGDKSAAWRAAVECAEENVPMPYWLARFILQVNEEFCNEHTTDVVQSLHDKFGLEEVFPTTEGRRRISRKNEEIGYQIYRNVRMLRHADKALSVNQAIDRLGEDGRLPCSKSKAYGLYKAWAEGQQRLQKVYDM